MKDPYKVLGISPSATDDEVKAAYKELVKKYHPDQYQGSPLSEVAEEKMTEVNAAYDEIMASRRSGGYSGGYSSQSSYGEVNYQEIRRMIQSGDITRADSMLDTVPQGQRSAEWFFLKGSVCYTRGWLNDAYANFQTACQMQPGNYEYQAALNQMNQQRGGYMAGNPMQGSGRSQASDTMDCCTTLCCADCCCEMMGGDLIPCC
ncbi:MAG: J domain-containing protein [Oscillospiraceae bacterium]